MPTTTSAHEPFPAAAPVAGASSRGSAHHVLAHPLFFGALQRERKRADRSKQPLALLVVSLGDGSSTANASAVITGLLAAKADTDLLGWLDRQNTLALLMPAIPDSTDQFAADVERRFRNAAATALGNAAAGRLVARVFVYAPSARTPVGRGRDLDRLIGQLQVARHRHVVHDATKRSLDVAVSAGLLILLAPVFAIIAGLVKLSSPGPVFFRQERIGQGMTRFQMFKFRTMYVNVDHAVHYDYISSFIKAGAEAHDDGRTRIFKLTNDRRITRVGRFLRKSSLDELPQLWNVLRGEMSLVGPRPPLQYEVDQYEPWHCRRVLEAKPGITGLWQVTGRSRTTFDEMVRLDLRYARTSSLWTDLKILLATPAAVIAGKGAA